MGPTLERFEEVSLLGKIEETPFSFHPFKPQKKGPKTSPTIGFAYASKKSVCLDLKISAEVLLVTVRNRARYGLYPSRMLRANTAAVMSAVVPGFNGFFESLSFRSSFQSRALPDWVDKPPFFNA